MTTIEIDPGRHRRAVTNFAAAGVDDIVDARFHIDADRLRAVGRMGGIGYATTRERYEMPIGREALTHEDPFV